MEGFECTLALVWSDKVPWTMEWEGSSSGEEREEGREGDVGDNGEKKEGERVPYMWAGATEKPPN